MKSVKVPISDTYPAALVKCLPVVVGLAALALHVIRLFRELWLDEYGTVWAISSNWSDLQVRASDNLLNSKIYYIVAWVLQHVVGTTPLALRVPTFLMSLGSAAIIALIGQALFSRRIGLLSAVFFMLGTHSPILFEDARPYGLAVLCAAINTLCLIKWSEKQSRGSAIAYGASCALVIYSHIFFGLLLICHLPWTLSRVRTGSECTRKEYAKQCLLALAICSILSIPVLEQVKLLLNRNSQLNFLSPPDFIGFIFAVIPIELLAVGSTLLGYLIINRGNLNWCMNQLLAGTHLSHLLLWLILPPCILLAVGYVINHPLMLGRYFSHQAIPAALLSALMVDHLFKRRSVPIATSLLALVAFSVFRVYSNVDDERWQAAFKEAETASASSCPLLMQPGLVESQQSHLFSDPLWYGYMSQSASYAGLSNEVILIPYSFVGTDNRAYLFDVVLPLIRRHNCAALVYRNAGMRISPLPVGEVPTPAVVQIDEALEQEQFVTTASKDFGFVGVMSWVRNTNMPELRG